MLSKLMALSLPLVLLVCDWYLLKRITWRDLFNKFYYGVILIPIVWMTFFSNFSVLNAHSWTDVLVWIWSFNFYLIKFIWPGHAVLFYDAPFPVAINNPQYFVNALIFILLAWVIGLRRNDRLLLFTFLFYSASIFFLLRFNVILDLVSGRFMYLPSVGWCFFFGVLVERAVCLSKRGKWGFCAMIVVLLGWMAALTVNTNERLAIWRDSRSLWQNQLRNAKAAY